MHNTKRVHKEGNTYRELTVDYELGGYSFFSGMKRERGIYVYLRDIKIANGDENATDYTTVIIGSSDDYCVFVKPLKRRSRKAEDRIFNILKNIECMYEDDKDKVAYTIKALL